jgi:hypothetical protein
VDGEVAFVVPGWPSIIPYLDLIAMIGQSRWLEGPDELHALLPPPTRFVRRVSRWGKVVF